MSDERSQAATGGGGQLLKRIRFFFSWEEALVAAGSENP